jgi:hypothetical protein
MVKFLLKELMFVQQNPHLFENFPLRIGNFVKNVNLRFPLAFVISDTQGADKICGRYVSYIDKIQRLHRMCQCHPSNATNTIAACQFVEMDAMMDVIDRDDKDELRLFSQSWIPDHAFRNMDFGNNRHGIYGATPSDVLHGIKLGIINYMLEILFDDACTPLARHHFEQAWKQTVVHVKQGGFAAFPRMYFPNGITELAKTTADENHAILFVSYILCCLSHGKAALFKSEHLPIIRINLFVKAFEKLLIFHAWMCNSPSFWQPDDLRNQRKATKAVKGLVRFLCDNFQRKSSQGWNLSKMHELLHITTLIDRFGSPMNYDSGVCERMHQEIAKRPGRQSQKRHSTFTTQAANRLADRYVIDVAHEQMSKTFAKLPPSDKLPPDNAAGGSRFEILASQIEDQHGNVIRFDVRLKGLGSLSSVSLEDLLYPGLVEFIIFKFQETGINLPTAIQCCSEYNDEHNVLFRAHHNFRSAGAWNDWALTAYQSDTAEGFTNVPVKIICFLPNGVPGNSSCHMVCHPCQWRSKKETELLRQWTLVPCIPTIANGCPYDIVPAMSLFKHCFVVPDNVIPGVVFQVLDMQEWHKLFVV